MRLLQRGGQGELSLTRDFGDETPPYAILSHTWHENQDEEVTFNDIEKKCSTTKAGYKKLQFCSQQAEKDGLDYFWVDTCCINKTDHVELSEAIISMFRWYRDAVKCYVYLADVSIQQQPDQVEQSWRPIFRQSRWFKRGWTLQELLAPASVEFFSQEGQHLGDKQSLESLIQDITQIPAGALRGNPLSGFSVNERKRWAANRETKKKEDRAYCLLGIFNVFIPLMYGEGGDHAFTRLEEEIDRRSEPPTTQNINSGRNMGASTLHQQTPAQEVMSHQGFLRSLSYPEMEYRYYDVDDVQDDTCGWLLNHEHYQRWRSGAGSSTLLMIRGKPGSGKSTAMKRAFKLARERAGADEAVISFFFNSRGVSMETKLEGFLRSTLHQLLEKPGVKDDEALSEWERKKSLIKSGWTWTVKELRQIFERCVRCSVAKISIFVDALDECESTSTARDLMDLLTKLGGGVDSGHPWPKVCVSSRHYPNIGVAEPLQIIVEETNEVDIMKYTSETLHRSGIDHNGLSTKITSRSEGIFLWAVLVIEQIREALENGEPRKVLDNVIDLIPRRLEELFQGLVDSIPVHEREQHNHIMLWILFAKRPLTLLALNHALAFKFEYSSYPDYERSDEFIQPDQMRKLLVKRTRGLVEAVNTQGELPWIAELESTFRVQFIHDSVRQFIQDSVTRYILSQEHALNSDFNQKRSMIGFAHNLLALSCFNYIKAVCIEADVIIYDTEQIIFGSLRSQKPSLRILTDRPFLLYAAHFGFEHAAKAEANGFPQLNLFKPPTDDATSEVSWWTHFTLIFTIYRKYRPPTLVNHAVSVTGISHWSKYITTQLAFACAFKLDSWINYLLMRNTFISREVELSKALCVTAACGHVETVDLLIQAGANVNWDELHYGNPLFLSLVGNRDEVVTALLRHGASVHVGSRQRDLLVIATLFCSDKIVRSLLIQGAMITERADSLILWINRPVSPSGLSALEAATRRDLMILKTLLEAAEEQRVPLEYYNDAFLAAQAQQKGQHAEHLKSAIMRLFEGGRKPISLIIMGLNSKISVIEMWSSTRIIDLKRFIQARDGLFVGFFMLVHALRVLHDDRTLSLHNIQTESTIHVLPRARWKGVDGG